MTSFLMRNFRAAALQRGAARSFAYRSAQLLNAIAIMLGSLLLTATSGLLFSQTLNMSDGTIVQGKTQRVGLNIGSINFYDNGQILKNLIGSINPGFEPLTDRQIWALSSTGTSTTFSVPNVWDGVPANYWVGATFSVTSSQTGGAENGCTGTVASNTGPNYPVSTAQDISPVITVSSACAGPFTAGDVVVISKTISPTPESWWESGSLGGAWTSVSGGGKLVSDTTDLCATCGTQSLTMDATVAGSSTGATWFFDASYNVDDFVLLNGTYQLSFWAKAVSGTPAMVISANRINGGFNCGTYTPKLTSTWAEYTFTCTANESVSSMPSGIGQVAFSVTGGAAYLDNVYFGEASTSVTNPTVLRNEVIQVLQNYFGTETGKALPGVFRDWLGQNGETLENWTQPSYAHGPTTSGGGYFIGPNGGGSVGLSLEDYLVICQFLGVDPYVEVPVTFSNQEAAQLVEFLAAPSGTTFGAKRAALGQVNPWTDVFNQIHLSFCNECWNGFSFTGQALPWRSNTPNGEYYYDYSVRSRDIFAAMRADSYYASSSFDLTMNAQTAITFSMDTAIQRAQPDSIEIEDYAYGTVSDFASDAALWTPAMMESYEKVTNPADVKNFYQSVTDYQSQKTCGANGATACKVNVYEWGQGTNAGTIDQTHLDYINAGAGQGVVMALQPLLKMQTFGILQQSLFSLTEYENGGPSGEYTKLWGGTVDMGGATNSLRPGLMGVSLVNQSIIGPMYSCPIANNATFNFAGSANGPGTGLPAMSSVPYLYAFCFENGTARSIVLVNTDLSNTHTITFAGSNTPTGTVTQRQFAPSSLDALNEAPTGSNTRSVQAAVSINTTTVNSPASITLPAHSVTALDYTSLHAPVAATPTFSPAAGTYTTAQTVAINDTTPGVTIYYTVDGSTPTTSSSVYSGPVVVAANQTLHAIALETGFTNSTVGSAAFVIAPVLPTPAFSVVGGTYTTAQSVVISDAQAGVVLYYTKDGSTPTTASPVYSGAISISANTTLNAIAVAAGYTNSAVASSVYLIAPVLPTPTFSPTTGSYSTTQTVSIADSASGAVIHYTTNGTTPLATSPVYASPITVAVNETLQAIAVQSGYTNSAPASATFNILGSVTNIAIGTDGFSASNFYLNGGATVASDKSLEVTDGGQGEAHSAWFSTKVPVQNFITDFTFQMTSAVADGMTFTIQNAGTAAVGGPGGDLGYAGIGNSVAVKFDIFSNIGEGSDSTGIYTDGAVPMLPSVDLTSSGVVLSSGDIIDAHLVYDGTNLTLTLTDTSTFAAVTNVFPVNIPSIVGATTAYVGFTGGSGGSTSVQKVLSWTYVSKSTSATASAATLPVFSPAAGTYTAAQSVTISTTTPSATIYYTTNGVTPTTSSSVYSAPIAVSSSQTLEAIAVATGYSSSSVASAAYTINLPAATPSFSPAAGTYTSSQSVTISTTTPGATIYYTTNGVTPTTSSSVYSAPITVSSSQTLKAIAVATGYSSSAVGSAAYTINLPAATPSFSPVAGTYTSSQSVTISTTTASATIYYTLNGVTPTTSSSVYSGPITVSSSQTLEAIAVASGYSNSATGSAAYTINLPAATPSFSLAAGTYTSSQSVTVSTTTPGATIYYTTNGVTPTTSSSVYSAPIAVSSSQTLEAIAVATGYSNSPVASAAYTINLPAATPSFSPVAGTYTSSQSVAISTTTPSATIYYTTNGATPTTSSSIYSAPITVSSSLTLKAIAVATGYSSSAVASAAYTINLPAGTPSFSPAAGTYTTSQSVTISTTTSNATIYYTTNGSTPTTGNSIYSGPITVSSSQTLKAIAVDTGYSSSAVGSAAYTINLPAATPSFSPAAGTYTSSQSVAISTTTSGATIYYTTNGATPTTSSSVYSGPITVSSSQTLEAIAVASGYSNSAAGSAAYTISMPAATPSFSLAAGTYTSSQSVTISTTTPSATIYYTTNGVTPTTSSSVYSGPITVSSSQTLEAIAVASGYSNSAVGSAAYTINLPAATPSFSPAAGTYTSTQSVAISTTTPNATIYYTTNGATPTTSNSIYSGPITVSSSQTLKAIAVDTGYSSSAVGSAAYTINLPAATPSFSPAAGTYTSSQSVTISTTTPSATIYYTLNGSTPTTSSSVYSGPITVSSSQTLEAIAVASGYSNSAAGSAVYTINLPAATPSFSPAAGTYTSLQSVTISTATPGATIYYTLNGSTPTTSSSVYSGPITVSSSQKLEAIAVATGDSNSAVGAAAYTILGSVTNISIGTDGFNASNFYLNGGASVGSDKTLQISDGGLNEARSAWFSSVEPVQYFTTDFTFQMTSAVADGMTFTIQNAGPTAVGGSGGNLGYAGIANSVAVKFDIYNNIGEGNDSTGIYTNGAVPMLPAVDLTSSGVILSNGDIIDAHLVYDGTNLTMTLTDTTTFATVTNVFPINIPSIVGGPTAYVGFTGGTGGSSAVQKILSWTYVSESASTGSVSTTPAPVFSPAGGTYTAAQTVTITDATAGATIYYTTDGSIPTTSSLVYSGPVSVSSSKSFNAIAVVTGYASSPVTSASYSIIRTYLNYATAGFSTSAFSLNGASVTSTGLLQITDGTANEARSAWFPTAIPVQKFVADFTFQQTCAVADGMTVTFQNTGLSAVGGTGSSLGYAGIGKSVAVKFDLYNNSGEGIDSTGLYVDGALPTNLNSVDLTSTGVNLHSGNVMHAHMVYDGTNLILTLTDTVTLATTTQVFPVNIPSIVGGSTAYVGFTGGTGGKTAIQQVLSFSYMAP